MSILQQIAIKIIREQELIIGPLAWIEAQKVSNLKVLNKDRGEVDLGSDEPSTIDKLVYQYERLFGRVSVEVCKDAAANLIGSLAPMDIPVSLR